jgi:hypothetical protein
LTKLIKFLRSCYVFRLSVFFSLVVISLLFITSYAEGAESGNGLFRALDPSLHITVGKGAGQTNSVGSVDPQKAYSEELIATPHMRVSLTDTLKLFLNLRPITKDYYEGRHDLNRVCTTLGLDILF